MNNFQIGMELYHKTRKIRCVIKKINVSNLIVELDQEITGKKKLELPKTHIGEWLFYRKSDIDLGVEQLALLNEYITGKKVSEYIRSNREEYERNLEIQRQIEIERQQKLIEQELKEKHTAEQRLLIDKILKERNISNLIHFTRVENLESILLKGFVPRSQLESENSMFFRNDNERLDGKCNCTCFSIEFPNCFLFKEFRKRQPGSKWVVLEVDAKLLIKHKGNKYFCYDNAARSDIRFKLFQGQLSTADDFEKMFSEEFTYARVNGSGCAKRIEMGDIEEFLPTSKQAEILISDVIPSCYIKSIYFEYVTDYNYFVENIVNKDIVNKDIVNKFRFQINQAYFLPRNRVRFKQRRQVSG